MTQEELIREVGKVVPNGVYSEDMIQLAFTMFNHGYQYAIDKACEWLNNNLDDYIDYCLIDGNVSGNKAFVEDFRKAMKGGEE